MEFEVLEPYKITKVLNGTTEKPIQFTVLEPYKITKVLNQ